MNPRAGATDLLVFEARPFSHLGTPPYELDYNLNQDECPVLFQERYDTIVIKFYSSHVPSAKSTFRAFPLLCSYCCS